MMLQFSQQAGCRERHLQRAYRNPLFASAAREITQAQVDQARRQDEEESARFQQDFHDLLRRAGELAGHADTEVVLDLKERIDRLYEQCAGLGGDHGAEKQALLKLNEVIMKAIRAAAANDPLAVEELDKEQAAREVHLKLLEYPLVPDLLRADSPIGRDDLVATLLSEDPETVRVAVSLFGPEQQAELRAEARELVQSLFDRGEASDGLRDSLAAVEAPLQ